MFEQLDEVVSLFQQIEQALSSPDVVSDQQKFMKLSIEHRNLQPIVETYRRYRKMEQDKKANEELIEKETGELREMAEEENESLKVELEELSNKLRVLLLPKDPNDDKNIMLEIRAGAGGDEAGIFAGELMRLYSKFAEAQSWRLEPMSSRTNAVGGFKEIVLMIRGERVYSQLKYESGVHRVQRVPQTETQGRVHTSTVTVAVLPEAEDVEIDVDPSELRIDVFRSSGPGGQSVNTTDSAVRITHEPSGLVVTCQDEKSQHKNKAKALKVLKTRLLDMERQKADAERSAARLSQVGTGDRSEKIRTYNFPQGRVTDHRIGVTLYSLDAFMEGDITGLIGQLNSFYEAENLKNQSSDGMMADLADLKKDLEN